MLDLTAYTIEEGMYKGKNVIWIRFPYNTSKIEAIKSITATYSRSMKAWYVPDNSSYKAMLGLPTGIGKDALARLAPVNQLALKRWQLHQEYFVA